MTKENLALGLAVVAVVITLIFSFGHASKNLFGSTSCQSTTCLTGGLRILDGALESDGTLQAGSAGTPINQALYGNCNLGTGAGSGVIAPFKTVAIDCGSGTNGASAIAGVLAGDTVLVDLPTTTPASLNSLTVLAADASSTPGFITIELTNASSSAITLTSSATSSLEFIDLR